MDGKTLIQVESPKTQSVDAIKSLLQYVGRSSDPMPTDVSLDNGRLVLVLNGKKDAYYCTTAAACSCPAAHWHKGACKHQRKFFPQSEAAKSVSESLRPTEQFKPISLLPSEERAAKSASMLIDCHDTRDIDAAYHSIKEDREMWAALGEA